MSPSLTIAAVTLGLQHLLRTALPPRVEVSSLPLAQAETFRPRAGARARVNVMLHRVAPNLARRSTLPSARAITGAEMGTPLALDLHFLVTVYGQPAPADPHGTERLLEAAFIALQQHPLLLAAELAAALPDTAGALPPGVARISPEAIGSAELAGLFTALRAEYRPTLAYVVSMAQA